MVWMSTFDSENQIRVNKSNAPFVQSVGKRRAAARDESGDCGDREAQPRAGQRSRVGAGSAADVRGRAPRWRPRHGRDARHVGADLAHGRAGAAGDDARRLHRVHQRHAGDGERAGQDRSSCRRHSQGRRRSRHPLVRSRAGAAIRCRPTATRRIWRRCAGRDSPIRSWIGWRSKIPARLLGLRTRRSHETPAARSCSVSPLLLVGAAQTLVAESAGLSLRSGWSRAVHVCGQRVPRIADENVERDAAVRRAVCLALIRRRGLSTSRGATACRAIVMA